MAELAGSDPLFLRDSPSAVGRFAFKCVSREEVVILSAFHRLLWHETRQLKARPPASQKGYGMRKAIS